VRARRSTLLAVLALSVAALSVARGARAQEAQEAPEHRGPFPKADEIPVPRLPPPLVLPEISHPRPDVGLDFALARMAPESETRDSSAIALVRASGEVSLLAARRLYFGGTWAMASGVPPDGALPLDGSVPPERAAGRKLLLGNIEPHVRVVFPLPAWLAAGWVFGVMVPTATYDRNGPGRSVGLAASSIHPTDWVHFLPGRWALRPGADLRILKGPFVFQARQGLDIVIDHAGEDRARTAARLLVHAGVLFTRNVEVSLEGTQVYFFFSDAAAQISDDRRTALTLGPAVRVSLRHVAIGTGFVTNIQSPLSPAVDSFIAGRVSLIGHLD
jgi:hypothetical protein